MRPRARRGLLALAALSLLPTLTAGCFGVGLLTDGTSVSGGTINNGYLRNGRRLPPRIGYVIPQLWQDRGANFGTDEMVNAIMRSARRVAKEYPGPPWGCRPVPAGRRREHPASLARKRSRRRPDLVRARRTTSRCRPSIRCRPMAVICGPKRRIQRRTWSLVPPRGASMSVATGRWCEPCCRTRHRSAVHVRPRGCALLLAEGQRQHDDEELLDRAEALLKQPGDSLPTTTTCTCGSIAPRRTARSAAGTMGPCVTGASATSTCRPRRAPTSARASWLSSSRPSCPAPSSFRPERNAHCDFRSISSRLHILLRMPSTRTSCTAGAPPKRSLGPHSGDTFFRRGAEKRSGGPSLTRFSVGTICKQLLPRRCA